MIRKGVIYLLSTLLLTCGGVNGPVTKSSPTNSSRIQPWSGDARYWQLEGQPVLLLGGTKDDSLFQIPDLEEHLDLLAEVGGNYIRNTMSDREDHDYEVHAFRRRDDGAYDLDHWNPEYWRRFERLIELTAERKIVVQIEVWDRFDHTRDNWLKDPFRPANNVNYTSEEIGLDNEYPDHPSSDKTPFFHTVAGMLLYEPRLEKLRPYQERFVEKMLSYTLGRGHVLYCMDNETSTDPAWGRYWMGFIEERASERGVNVYVTDMFDDGWKPEESEKLRQAFDDPAAYTFLDISQVNSRNFGEDHWNRVLWLLEQAKEHARPANNVKIYGDGNSSWGSGSPRDGIERFWRHLIAGSASARFHRDGSGTGLQPISQASIRAARKVESLVRFWDVEPRQDLLADREENEAYLAARTPAQYVLYFTDGGSVELDLSDAPGEFSLRWVSVASGDWGPEADLRGGSGAKITAPSPGGWVAVVVRR